MRGKEYVYVWADGIYVKSRLDGEKTCLLVMIGVGIDGKKEYISTKNYPQALHVVDSIIKSKQAVLPRFTYLDRFLSEEERVDAANARADIYELQWMRIGILKAMGNRALLVEALNDYCTVIGYNQDKAMTMLDSLENE